MVQVGFSDCVTFRHMYVNAKIENEDLVALVDTGASGFAFVSISLCDRLNISSLSLDSPVSIVGFEPNNSFNVIKKVNNVLTLDNHRENISALLILNSKYDLILGLSWPEKT